MPMRVLVVVNPQASRAADALPTLPSWFAERADSTFVASGSQDELKQALSEHGPGADRIVVGGGDGTISSALPELLALAKPLAVLPLGTANDFANTLGVPADVYEAAEIALSGRPHKIDVGLVNGTPFLNVASVGVAANVAHAQSPALKRRWRMFAYVISLIHATRKSNPFVVTITVDGQTTWSGPVYQVSVGNGRFHGGGLTVADHAAIDDGKLDLYLVSPGPFWELVACITHLKFGFAKPVLLQRSCADHVTLVTSHPKPINADGETRSETPAEISVLRHGLTVIVPQKLPAGHRGLIAIGGRAASHGTSL
ncbi:MAG TPA: YegS/Rv2252/BmrU family lipid kinase [Methyloceanibacter sp.]|nr:YegS/Rv2252/BmrU family lipid kinase [Methyloceanibacter sp.]